MEIYMEQNAFLKKRLSPIAYRDNCSFLANYEQKKNRSNDKNKTKKKN